jgi:hypothetical protein
MTTPAEFQRFSASLPLQYSDKSYQDVYYVDRLAAQPRINPVRLLQQAIKGREVGSYLFSGHRGVGKTTELKRLIADLNKNGVIALYCDASAYLNLSTPTLTLSDVLFTLCAGLADALEKHPAYSYRPGEETWGQKLWRLLNARIEMASVEIKVSADLPAATVEASTSLKLMDNPSFQQKLREFVSRSTDFFDEVNKYVDEVVGSIPSPDKPKVVLVLDSLERLSASRGEEDVLFRSLKEIFDHNPARLHLRSLSVVYAVPPYLRAIAANVDNHFNGSFQIPHFKVIGFEDGKILPLKGEDEGGLKQMRAVIAGRYAEWQGIFAPVVLDELARQSGGNLRVFFRLILTLLSYFDIEPTRLPLTDPAHPYVRDALADIGNAYAFLTAPQVEWLKRITEHPDKLLTDESSIGPLLSLFDQQLVLDYRNGSSWYQVMPIVARRYGL